MTDFRPANSTTRLRDGRLWAAVLALLFSFQAVMAAVPPAPRAADVQVISKSAKFPVLGHVRDTANVVVAVAKGTKLAAGSHGDGNPSLLVVAHDLQLPVATSNWSGRWALSGSLPSARSGTNRARAPPIMMFPTAL